jgi:hypothetical protein
MSYHTTNHYEEEGDTNDEEDSNTDEDESTEETDSDNEDQDIRDRLPPSIRSFLETLAYANDDLRRSMLSKCTDQQLEAVITCLDNALHNPHVDFTASERRILGPHKGTVLHAVNPDVPLHKKRKTLVQEGGFLGTLLMPVLQTISHLLFK